MTSLPVKFPRIVALALVIASGAVGATRAEFRPDEAQVYPAGFPTADVLKKSEMIFAPHGWFSVGLTPQLTATVDWLTTVFGVPAGVLRYQPPGQGEAKYALELYGLYAPRTVDTNRSNDFKVTHKGGIAWLHLMRTAPLSRRARLHLYAGASYLHDVGYKPKEHVFEENRRIGVWTPDGGIGMDVSINPALKVNVNAYHGNSFYYFDQDARKTIMTYGLYWSPFSSRRHPLLANARLEVNGYWVYIRDPRFHDFSIPFFPVLTWQWGG